MSDLKYENEKGRTDQELGLESEENVAGTEAVHSTNSVARSEGVKPAFVAKVGVLSQAIAECGMGRYQWDLFITAGKYDGPFLLFLTSSWLCADCVRPITANLAGFGWFADNIWLQVRLLFALDFLAAFMLVRVSLGLLTLNLHANVVSFRAWRSSCQLVSNVLM